MLTGKAAVELFDRAPESVGFSLSTFVTYFGLTEAELQAELIAGRIVASGLPTADGYSNITISAKSLLDWIGNANSPQHLVHKTMEALSGNLRQQ